MKWYYWVATYIIIIAGVLWTIIPYKSVWFNLVIIAVIAGGVYFLRHYPPKAEKQ